MIGSKLVVARGGVEWKESICVYKGAAGGSSAVMGQFWLLIVDTVTQNCMYDKILQDYPHIHK